MFCMNCGQVLPDGAKFCLKCGTPLGSLSSTGSPSSETINLDGTHTFVPAKCPNCGAQLKVDSSFRIAHCASCDTDCLVQDAIKTLTVRGNVQVGNATINVSGTNPDSLLKRVEIMIADGDFSDAISKCDTILDSDPTNGNVYFLMLLANLRCRNRNDLANYPIPFDNNKYYFKAIQFGDDSLKSELVGYVNAIKVSCEARREQERKEYELRKEREQAEYELKRKKEEENELRRKREKEEFEAKLINLNVGDEIDFGTNNGRKIKWKILRMQDRRALMITNNAVCEMPYHQSGLQITWKDCTLRKWLNNDFINCSFTEAEKNRILPSVLNNDNNPKYKTLGGSPTTDKIFLLSVNEAKDLFVNNLARAIFSDWWLRTPGDLPHRVVYVVYGGSINIRGGNSSLKGGVRPAMWIKLN